MNLYMYRNTEFCDIYKEYYFLFYTDSALNSMIIYEREHYFLNYL